MNIIWAVRAWIVIVVACAALTFFMLLTGCASWQTSDCARNKNGMWVCTDKEPANANRN